MSVIRQLVKNPREENGSSENSSENNYNSSAVYLNFSEAGLNACDRNTDNSTKEYKLFLPEYELLEFVLKSNFTMKLEEYYGLYGNVPMRDIYKDKVWPVPHDFIPYDVFENPYECVTELPKEHRYKKDRSMSIGTGGDTPLASKNTSSISMVKTVMDILNEGTSDSKSMAVMPKAQQKSLSDVEPVTTTNENITE